MPGLDDALKGEIGVGVGEGGEKEKEGREGDKGGGGDGGGDNGEGGIGEEAEAKIEELTKSNKSANGIIDKLGGIDKAAQWVEYLSGDEFKSLVEKGKKGGEGKSDSEGGKSKDSDYVEALDLIKKLVQEGTAPLQSQLSSLSKQSTDRITSLESRLTSSNLNEILSSLSTKYPDLTDYRKGIVERAKDLFPKGNFTEGNIKDLYLLAKIEAGKIGDGINKEKIKDVSELDLSSIKEKSKGKSFSEIGLEIANQMQ